MKFRGARGHVKLPRLKGGPKGMARLDAPKHHPKKRRRRRR